MIEDKIFESTDCLNAASNSGVTSIHVMVDSARSVGWGRNEAVTLLYFVPWQSALMCSMETHSLETFLSLPLTRIYIGVAVYCVFPLLFLKSVSILSGCHGINICGGH
jgi:hypothetical protein